MASISVTSGELLLSFIQENLMGQNIAKGLESRLIFTGRQDELSEFIQELIAVNTVGRIVIAGESITDHYHITDPLFEKELTYYLKNFFRVDKDNFGSFYRLSLNAVKASKESISATLQKKMRLWAMSGHNFCYMCGVLLNFDKRSDKTDDEKRREFTSEHIWPRQYGGNSTEENLLPCCSLCNSSRKTNFATWAMPSIQSLIRGFNPGDECLSKIEGSHRFAIHYRCAQKFACKKNVSLKEAFLKIGPWKDIRIKNEDDVADFFNLENHNDKGRAYGIYL